MRSRHKRDYRRGGPGLVASVVGALLIAIGSALAGAPDGSSGLDFDRAALQKELARSALELKQQGPDALQAHVRRLTEMYASLDLAKEVSPEERRVLSDNILARVAQAGHLLREGRLGSQTEGRGRGPATRATALGVLDGAASLLTDNSILLVGLLGGAVIAFSLGSLAGYRRGASQASYYGESDPRMWFVARDQERRGAAGQLPRITLPQIREALAAGRTVLMQLGYEIAPERRMEYLELMCEMQRILGMGDGQTYSVWEDPRHPDRFYELLTCHKPAALDRLTRSHGELSGLAARVEACRAPGRPVLRRAWWGVLPERGQGAARVSLADRASARERGRWS
jgi:hypothetical protein